jgi:hypothetical protein
MPDSLAPATPQGPPQLGTAQATPPASFDSMAAMMRVGDQAQAANTLSGSLFAARQTPPDKAAQAQSMGVDPKFVDYAKSVGVGVDPEKFVKETPKTAAALSDPKVAAVAHDDLDNLQATDKLIQQGGKDKALTQGLISANYGVQAQEDIQNNTIMGKVGSAMMQAVGEGVSGLMKTPGFLITDIEAGPIPEAIKYLNKDAYQVADKWSREHFNWTDLGDPGSAINKSFANPALAKDEATNYRQAFKEGGIPAVTAKIAETTAGVAPLFLTGPYGFGAMVASSVVQTTEDAKEKGIDPVVALAAGAAHGGALVLAGKLAEFGPTKFLKNLIGEAGNVIGPAEAEQAIKSGLTNGVKNILQKFYHGSLGGAFLTTANDITDKISGAKTDAFDHFGDQVLDSTLGWGPLQAIMGMHETFGPHSAQVQEAMGTAQDLEGLKAKVGESKVLERSPVQYNQILKKQLEGSHLEERLITRDKFEEICAKHNVDPATTAKDLGMDYDQGAESRSDLKLKTADLMTKLKDNPAQDSLMADSRSEADGMTPNEAKEEVKRVRTKALKEKSDFDQSVERVRQSAYDNMIEAGESPAAAELRAKLVAAHVQTNTPEFGRNPGHEGSTPEDFANFFHLTEAKPGEKPAGIVDRIKQALGGGKEAEPTDENGLTEAQRKEWEAHQAKQESLLDKQFETHMTGVAPLTRYIQDSKGLDLGVAKSQSFDKEVPSAQRYGLLRKEGGYQPDTLLQELQQDHKVPQDWTVEDLKQALNREHNRLDQAKAERLLRRKPKEQEPTLKLEQEAKVGPDEYLPENKLAKTEQTDKTGKEETEEQYAARMSGMYADEAKLQHALKSIRQKGGHLPTMDEIDAEIEKRTMAQMHPDLVSDLREHLAAWMGKGQHDITVTDADGNEATVPVHTEDGAYDAWVKAGKPERRAAARENQNGQQGMGEAGGENQQRRVEDKVNQASGGAKGPSLTLEQNARRGARGDINFFHNEGTDPTKGFHAVLQRFAQSDLSTGVHEFGHYMVETMRGLAGMENASEQVKADLASLEKFANVKDGKWEKDNHEKVAKGLEQYMLEGKAPSKELQPVFARLKNWIVSAYKNLTQAGLPMLNDEVRSVYDRMLATPDEIAKAHADLGQDSYLELSKNPRVAKAQLKAQEASENKLTQAKFAQIVRRETDGWKQEYDKERADIKATMEQENRPAHKAEMAFSGKDHDGEPLKDADGNPIPALKLDASRLKDLGISKGSLPRGATVEKGGMDPDAAAESLGYPGGIRDLIRDMQKNRPFEQELDGRAKAAADFLADKHPLETVAQMARDAVHNTDTAELQRLQSKELVKQNPAAAMKLLESELKDEFRGKLDDVKKSMAEKAENAEELLKHKIDELKMNDKWFRAGARKFGSLFLSNEDIRAKAHDEIADKAVGEVNPNDYAAAERRARKAANEAHIKNDWEGALEAKGQELFAHECYKAAQEAKEEIQKGKDWSKRYDKASIQKKIGSDYLDQVNQVRELVGLRGQDTKLAAQRDKLIDWARGLAENGNPVQISDWLAQLTNPTNFKDVKMENFRQAIDAMKSIEHIAQDVKSLNTRNGKITVDEGVAELKAVMTERGEKVSNAELEGNEIKLKAKGSTFAKIGHLISTFARVANADLLGPDYLKEMTDNGLINGPFGRHIYDRLLDANYAERDMRKAISDHFGEIGKKLGKEWQDSLGDMVPNEKLMHTYQDGTSAPRAFTRAEMLGLARHYGNESNLAKVTKGWGWDAKDVFDFLQKNMTSKDWEATQAHWDVFDPLFKKSDEMIRRLGGVSAKKIDARPFEVTLPDGTVKQMKGGYSPLNYDPLASKKGFSLGGVLKSIADGSTDKIGKQMVYNATTTRDGSMIERNERYSDKVSLDLHSVDARIRDTIHDLAYREHLMDIAKILKHPEFRNSFSKTFGPEYLDGMEKMVNGLRDQFSIDPDQAVFEKALRYTRQGVVLTGASLRASILWKHETASMLKSLGYTGGGEGAQFLAARLARMGTGHWGEDVAEAGAKSGEIRARLQQQDRDFSAGSESMYKAETAKEKWNRFGHSAFSYLDTFAAVPTWHAAHDLATTKGVPKSMGGTGEPMTEADAVHYADRMVREAHGTATEAARSNFVNSGGIKGLFGTFYGFMNNTYGQVMTTADQMRGGSNFSNQPALMGRMLATLVVPGLAVGLLEHKKGENWAWWAAKSVGGELAATVPFLRNAWKVTESLLNHRQGGADDPVSQSIETGGHTLVDAIRESQHLVKGGKQPHTQIVQDAADLTGILTHIGGLGQLGHVGQFVMNAAENRKGYQGLSPLHAVKKAVIGGE